MCRRIARHASRPASFVKWSTVFTTNHQRTMAGKETSLLLFVVALFFVYYFIRSYSLGKLFQKAHRPLWAGFVPIYCYVVWAEVVGRPTWLAVLTIVPYASIVVEFIFCIDTAKSFGESKIFGVLMGFFTVIFMPILAFTPSIEYRGPSVLMQTTE
jgi:hypothetical protein